MLFVTEAGSHRQR